MDTLGAILLEQGEKQRALELLRKASQQQPENRDIRYNLAKARHWFSMILALTN